MTGDIFQLARFVDAQASVWPRVLAELAAGRKQSHWMWFVFPQIAGLGNSPMAQHYAIHGIKEARAYLAHDLLGPRLIEATRLVLAVEGGSAHDIFGSPDDLKFRSSMTLFHTVAPDGIFAAALEKYFSGERDPATLAKLNA